MDRKKDIENEPEKIRAQLSVARLKDYDQKVLFLKRTEEETIQYMKPFNTDGRFVSHKLIFLSQKRKVALSKMSVWGRSSEVA